MSTRPWTVAIAGGSVIAMSILAACTNGGEIATTPPKPEMMSGDRDQVASVEDVLGTIIEHLQTGKDGSVWLLRADDGRDYELLLSIPNLGRAGAGELQYVAVNARVEVSGKVIRISDLDRIIAKRLHVER